MIVEMNCYTIVNHVSGKDYVICNYLHCDGDSVQLVHLLK